MTNTLVPIETGKPGRSSRGKPLLYGERTVRRSVDIPESLHTLLQRRVAEENFRAGRPVTSQSRMIVDLLYDFFGLHNPIDE